MNKNETHIYISKIEALKNNKIHLTPTQKTRLSTLSAQRAKDFELIQSNLNTYLMSYLNCSVHDLSFKTSPLGKPYLENNPIYFNLSHSRDVVAYSFSMMPVGVDIELNRDVRNPSTILKRILSEDTLGYMSDYSFFETWTKIESFVKCLGLSLFSIEKDQRFDLIPMEFQGKLYHHQFLENEFDCVISLTRKGDLGEIVRL